MNMNMNTDSMLQYKVKNTFNSEVINATKKVVLGAKFDGFKNVLKFWKPRLNDMINADMNNIEINKDYIEEAKDTSRKMIQYLYKN